MAAIANSLLTPTRMLGLLGFIAPMFHYHQRHFNRQRLVGTHFQIWHHARARTHTLQRKTASSPAYLPVCDLAPTPMQHHMTRTHSPLNKLRVG